MPVGRKFLAARFVEGLFISQHGIKTGLNLLRWTRVGKGKMLLRRRSEFVMFQPLSDAPDRFRRRIRTSLS